MTKLYATFDGQVLRPEEPLSLPPNTRVRLLVEPAESPVASGEARSFLDVALSLELEGPPDWSARLDEYLYGSDEGPAPLKTYLKRHRQTEVTERLNEVYRDEESSLDPVMAAIQSASLPRGE